MVLFARRVAHFTEVDRASPTPTADTARLRASTGELFFASSNDLVHQFDYAGDPDNVVIDLSGSHIWDASTVAALDAITTKYAPQGQERRHRRPERRQRRAPRTPRRPPRRRSLTLSTRWGLLPTRWVPPARPQSPE